MQQPGRLVACFDASATSIEQVLDASLQALSRLVSHATAGGARKYDLGGHLPPSSGRWLGIRRATQLGDGSS